MSGSVDPPVLLFDGDCVLCNAYFRFVLAHERVRDPAQAIRFATVQSPAGQRILAAHGLPLTDWESNVFLEGGRALQRTDAFFAVAAHLRAPWSWLRLGRFLPRALGDRLYALVARNRYRLFGKRAACYLPGAKERDRFLD